MTSCLQEQEVSTKNLLLMTDHSPSSGTKPLALIRREQPWGQEAPASLKARLSAGAQIWGILLGKAVNSNAVAPQTSSSHHLPRDAETVWGVMNTFPSSKVGLGSWHRRALGWS